MSALTADRNTPLRIGERINAPVAAGKTIYAGAIVVANSSGFAEPGKKAKSLTYLGRADAQADNSDGSDGDVNVDIRRMDAFQWANSTSDPVKQANLGATCYIEDDQTVSATNGSSTQSAAGTVIAIDTDGVWVQ